MSEQTNTDMSKHFYRASAAGFMKIPGSPVAYWVTESVRDAFKDGIDLGEIAPVRQGLATADNDRFLRFWPEISINKFGLGMCSSEEAIESGKKWFPYNKGGDFRKWYGNNEFVVNWENNGHRIKNFTDSVGKVRSRPQNTEHYFKKSITWSFVSSAYFGVRYSDSGAIFDVGGSSAFPNEQDAYWLTGFLCSKQTFDFMRVMNPTLNFQVGNVASLPILQDKIAPIKDELNELSQRLIEWHKTDWNSFEEAWDFTGNPLVSMGQEKINDAYVGLIQRYEKTIEDVIEAEYRVNELLISAYGLEASVTPELPRKQATLSVNPLFRYNSEEDDLNARFQSDTLCELVSYSIGCMMGRYSLDKPGLILASQGETIQDYLAQIPSPKFMPDDDAILPLTDQEWFADDITNRFREFVKVVWGEETLQENLDFVAESLCLHAIKPKKGETSMETIRRYLSAQFYKDHMKTYKKRPIYWLFSSGKQKAFECLVYLHRYNEGTLSRMRTEYVTPLMGKYESQIRHIEEQQTSASAAEKTKLGKELKDYQSKLNELREFDSKLKHYADMRISLDLDDGVKVNYGKFGDLLANVKDITGEKPKLD